MAPITSSIDNFNKETIRFTYQVKKELLQEILAEVTTDNESPYFTLITEKVTNLTHDLQCFEKHYKTIVNKKCQKEKPPPKPRVLSAYNRFIQKTLPQITDKDNKIRMSKASEIWRKLTSEEKAAFKIVEEVVDVKPTDEAPSDTPDKAKSDTPDTKTKAKGKVKA
jgi:deoxyribodipyrimidine photolyase